MSCSRRSFLLRGLVASGGAAVASLLPGCERRIDPAPVADVPAPVNGKLSLEVARYPDLVREGGALTVRAPGLVTPILALHTSGDKYAALSSICSHAGCPLGYVDGDVECPCHGSRFDLDGKVLNPPAKQGLKSYPVAYDATSGHLIVDLAAGDANFPPLQGGKVVLKLSDFPQLAKPGGSVVGIPDGFGRPLLVIALPDGSYSALDATCTHLGCQVSYAPASGDIECPCHASTFSTAGSVTKGPATKALVSFAATHDATAVTVTIG